MIIREDLRQVRVVIQQQDSGVVNALGVGVREGDWSLCLTSAHPAIARKKSGIAGKDESASERLVLSGLDEKNIGVAEQQPSVGTLALQDVGEKQHVQHIGCAHSNQQDAFALDGIGDAVDYSVLRKRALRAGKDGYAVFSGFWVLDGELDIRRRAVAGF